MSRVNNDVISFPSEDKLFLQFYNNYVIVIIMMMKVIYLHRSSILSSECRLFEVI